MAEAEPAAVAGCFSEMARSFDWPEQFVEVLLELMAISNNLLDYVHHVEYVGKHLRSGMLHLKKLI